MLVETEDNLSKHGHVDRFFSVSEFLATYGKKELDHCHAGRDWAGGVSFDESITLARLGDNRAVDEAEKIMLQLDTQLVDTVAHKTVYGPFGPRLDIGRLRAGVPFAFKRRTKRTSDIGPIKVVVTISCSAGIDAEDMKKRGAAIIAFLLKLQSFRPVELYALIDAPNNRGRGPNEKGDEYGGWRYALIGIDSKPISTSQAGFVIGHPAFFRHLGHCWKQTGAWPQDRGSSGYSERLAMRLGLDHEDVIIPEVFMGDPLIDDPLSWIDDQLDKLVGRMAAL